MTKTIRFGVAALVLALGSLTATACKNADAVQSAATAPVAGSIAGAWTTHWGSSEICALTLQQNGNAITGNYTTTGAPPGTVAGTFANNVLTGTWTDQAGGGGGMALTFTADGRSFSGTWGTGASTTNGGTWTGTR